MNANELWAGHEYAWIPNRGRGQTFSYSVKRIKVQSVRKVQLAGNDRKSTIVSFEVLDLDGNSLLEPNHTTAAAREITDFWDNFYSEYEEKIESRISDEREQVKKERLQTVINQRLRMQISVKLGIAVEHINITGNWNVSIPRPKLIEALGIDAELIARELD